MRIGKTILDEIQNTTSIAPIPIIVDMINVDSILDRLDTEMNGWTLSEPVKTACLVQVMDILEVAIQDDSKKFSAINQIRKMLSLNFYVKS